MAVQPGVLLSNIIKPTKELAFEHLHGRPLKFGSHVAVTVKLYIHLLFQARVACRIGQQEIVHHPLADPAIVLANLSDLLLICHTVNISYGGL